MKRRLKLWLAAILAIASIGTLGGTPAPADVIMDWNAKADAIATQKQVLPVPHGRALAMLHIAMFEAVNTGARRLASR